MFNTNNKPTVFSFFWNYIKPYKWYYLTMLLVPILAGLYLPLSWFSIKLLIDTITTSNSTSLKLLFWPITIYMFAQIFMDVIWRFSNYAEWKSDPYVKQAITSKAFSYIQDHSYKFFHDNHSGNISSKVKSIFSGYEKIKTKMHHSLLYKCSSYIASVLTLLFVQYYLGILMIIWTIAFYCFIKAFYFKLNTMAHEVSDSKHRIFGLITDNITNILSVKFFAAKHKEFRNLNSLFNKSLIPKEIRFYKYDCLLQIIIGLYYIIMLFSILFLMIYLKNKGMVTIGDFSLAFGLIFVVADYLWIIAHEIRSLIIDIGELKQSFTILQIPHDIKDGTGSSVLKVKDGTIEFKNITFSYKENKQIFKNFNLIIEKGDSIGLVGHSGAGKSSLINLLLRCYEVNSGSILIDNQDINTITQDSLRKNIAYIPQDITLFHRSILNNIQYGNFNATKEQIINAAKKAHAHEFISKMEKGYDTMVGERGIKLSGGERQRIAIARAILKNAPIYILDEATSSLDSVTEQSVQQGIKEIINNKKHTVIVIAHRLSTLKRLNKIIVIDNGEIIQQGSHKDLMKIDNGKYKQLWDIQKSSLLI